MEADDPTALVQPAPVPGERAAERERPDITQWRDTVSLVHASIFAQAGGEQAG